MANGAIALCAGLLLGVCVAAFRDRADDRVRERKDIEIPLRTHVLSAVPPIKVRKGSASDELVALAAPDSAAAEAFRHLRANLVVAAGRDGAKSILVTSCQEQEGKTLTAANLAIALARANHRVIAVSATCASRDSNASSGSRRR